jgi:CheY-like chemotaxis protein
MLGFTVLIIDDQEPILVMVSGLLETLEGVKTLEASTSQEGLDMAKLYSPDLILLDLTMPEIDGSEVFLRLKSSSFTRHIPVVIFTGTEPDDERMLKLRENGATAFLSKPFESEDLFEIVRKIQNH